MYFFFIVASIWMVISITYNRFVAVVFPHKTASLNTVGKSYLIIFLTLFFSFAINMPHFFNFHPIQDTNGHWAAGKTDEIITMEIIEENLRQGMSNILKLLGEVLTQES